MEAVWILKHIYYLLHRLHSNCVFQEYFLTILKILKQIIFLESNSDGSVILYNKYLLCG